MKDLRSITFETHGEEIPLHELAEIIGADLPYTLTPYGVGTWEGSVNPSVTLTSYSSSDDWRQIVTSVARNWPDEDAGFYVNHSQIATIEPSVVWFDDYRKKSHGGWIELSTNDRPIS